MPYDIHDFRCRTDNVGILIRDQDTGLVAAIDAPDENAIFQALEEKGWRLDHILITHGHFDHVAGVKALKQRFGCKVTAPALTKLEDADNAVGEGDDVAIGSLKFSVWHIPGHSPDHLAYYCADENLLFCADTLFVMGCGRASSGEDYPNLYASLKRIKALPDETRFYCGHDYYESNLTFARMFDPALTQERSGFVSGGLLRDEKKNNPFLRLDDAKIRDNLGLNDINNFTVFSALRDNKNKF